MATANKEVLTMKIFDHESGKFYTGSPDLCLKKIKSFIDKHEVKIKKMDLDQYADEIIDTVGKILCPGLVKALSSLNIKDRSLFALLILQYLRQVTILQYE